MNIMTYIKTKKKETKLIPVINLNKCQSDGKCVNSCTSQALGMKEITEFEFSHLSIIGKLKTRFHGREKAMVLYPENCIGCGKCAKICPEKAIKPVSTK
jgi:NAD-dependent dihydropyrimidine dehydrogenase PreA subunit